MWENTKIISQLCQKVMCENFIHYIFQKMQGLICHYGM